MKFAIVAVVAALHLCMIISSSSASKKRHKRDWIIDSFSIQEEHPGPFPYELGKVHVERDYRVRFQLHGHGVDEEPVGLLRIDEDRGIIYVQKKVDYEKYQVLKLKFEARNASNSELDTRLGVEIAIQDVNDQIPTFQKQVYEVTIDESQKQGTSVLTVIATDDDKSGSLNATVEYDIVSVTPKTSDVEFFIEQNGRISFKGCLNYEKVNKYTILVEGKDLGEQVQQSSTCTTIIHVRDKNNHMPVFSGNAREGRVTERESGVSPLRIQVTDEDTKGTTAWKVKYTIQDDREGNFQIQTDPETNDGILTVVKPLDYESTKLRQLSITAENEEPYFSCELKRKTPGSLWKVNYVDGDPGRGGKQVFVSQSFTIHVDDVNDPPEFPFSVKEAVVDEDEVIGHLLETFTAEDSDGENPEDIVYVKGDDPGGWVSVDPKTGAITTANALDRESPHVVNGSYLITVFAIDKGEPPMTATATLTLHVTDKNDNAPEIYASEISMCLSDDNTMTNISAYDLDGPPYGGPFRFELLGEDKKKWSIDPNYGTTVNLIKKNTVYAGHHDLRLKIFDQQEIFSIQNISVIVCDCSVRVDCLSRRVSTRTAIGSAGIGMIFAGILALVGLMLLALLLTCGRKKIEFPFTNESGDVLLTSNIEKPGTDCKMPETPRVVKQELNHTAAAPSAFKQNGIQSAVGQNGTQTAFGQSGAEIAFGQNGTLIQSSALPNHQILAVNHQQVASQGMHHGEFFQSREAQIYQAQQHYSNAAYKTMSLQRSFRRKDQARASSRSMQYPLPYRDTASFLNKELLSSLVSQRLTSIQTAEEDQSDYEPKAYMCEEDPAIDPDLDRISIAESNFAPDDLLNLGPRFQNLAAICNPKSAKP